MSLKNILISVGIILITVGVFLFALSDFLPANLSLSSSKDSSIENEFASIEGAYCIPDISSYEVGTLIDVVDGDSIRVAIQGSIFEVRYIGIDTPEYNSDQRQAAVKATEANRDVLSTSFVYLFEDQSETDKYGRLLRYVISNDKFINLELVKSGHAKVKKYYPDTSCHLTFEQAVFR